MICRLENPKFIFRKLKISDYQNFSKLFYQCFKKKSVTISINGDILMIDFLFVMVLSSHQN